MGSLDSYLPIFILFVLAALFAGLSIVASRLLAPQRPNAAKEAPYECGIVPTYEPPQRFPVRFYLVAMIFIIFDIEIIFLFPWAVDLQPARSLRARRDHRLRRGGVLLLRLPRLQRRARLGPDQARPAARHRRASRTTESTVRRVGSSDGQAA